MNAAGPVQLFQNNAVYHGAENDELALRVDLFKGFESSVFSSTTVQVQKKRTEREAGRSVPRIRNEIGFFFFVFK